MKRTGIVAAASAGCLLLGAAGVALASPPAPASGTITQTSVIDQDVRFAGPNMIVETVIAGDISGTLSGTVEDSLRDSLRLVIHPNGRFNAHGTLTCECAVDGKEGVLELAVTNTGSVVQGIPTFEGRYVIKRGTGELSGLRGVLEFEGTVDLATGLSTITYSGQIHSHP